MTVERLSASLAERYTLESELGQGGMATVDLARDVKHDRQVAVKVLRPELSAVLGRERFLSEIRLTAKLDHPHILTLLDSGESDGFVWYTLPYIRGESLRHKLDRETQLGVDEAVSITRQIAGALEHAHQHGIIHRDVKLIVEALIKEAQERGEFDKLPGKGKPIDLTSYFETPEEVRLAQSVLKNAGMISPEVQPLKEIAELRQLQEAVIDEGKKQEIRRKIQQKQMELGLMMERQKRHRS